MKILYIVLLFLLSFCGTATVDLHSKMELAKSYITEHKLEEAIKVYNSILIVNSQFRPALIHKGKALFYLGKYEESKSTFSKAYKLNIADLYAAFWMYKAEFADGKGDKDLKKHLYALSELNISNLELLYQRAKLSEEDGGVQEALEMYQKALDEEPQLILIYLRLYSHYKKAGMNMKALEFYEKAVLLSKNYPSLYNKIVEVKNKLK
ncbi:MAG: tetratricopeptide repeat protein [Leptospiraceae bacterium]|nr:tetratricopeptide repeat protein [Leptospiraceae bacterium]MCP5500490.1 tetratricopeptide repeat protein [Leptospiraceae bacterium]